MEKKLYIEPEMEVIVFETSDVITTSGGNENNQGPGIGLPDDVWN